MQKKLIVFSIFLSILLVLTQQIHAFEPSKLGIHILSINEVERAKTVVALDTHKEQWNYVTIPLTLNDLKAKKAWQDFFNKSKEFRIIPLVRLTTRFNKEQNVWEVPTKRNIVNQINFLSSLDWPTDEKHIIAYNEVNQAKEWGGNINPEEYTRVLRFVADWAHTENKNYVVLPAGLDLAAPNGIQTQEAFSFLNSMLAHDPNIFEVVDIWNSHSYPNPGFSSSPTRIAKNSLRGYQFELDFLKQKTGRDFNVMITETGWEENAGLSKWLASYYSYAFEHIWSDKRVLAVTPFVLKGAPGPYAGFSFLDENDKPTNQFYALQSALKKILAKSSDFQIGSR